MKLTILPNWGKWLSLALIVSAFCLDFTNLADAFIRGYRDGAMLTTHSEAIPAQTSSDNERTFPIADVLILLSIVVYILSKDKRDDEFINAIRAQALLAALLITSVVVILVSVCNGRLDSAPLLFIQLLSYIVIFKIMKINRYTDYDEPLTE